MFEYSGRVQLRGTCQAGMAEQPGMQAAEVNSLNAGAVPEEE